MAEVVIVGAGLSGLAVAFRLRQLLPDLSLKILEARSIAGGNIGTEVHDGFRVETGPNGFLDNKPGTLQLCQDLGLGDELLTASEGSRKNRYLFLKNRLHKLPGSPLGLLTTPLLSWTGKLDLLAEPFRSRPASTAADESVAAFARRRFGKEAAEIFMDALVTGIQAGDPEQLSVKAAFPRLVEMEAKYGSIFRALLAAAKERKRAAQARGEPPPPQRMWSFREGLGRLITVLQQRIAVPVTTGVAVRRIRAHPDSPSGRWLIEAEGSDRWLADVVVLCCPAHQQAPILAELDEALSREIAEIPFNRIVVAALGYRQSDVPERLDGFGFIAPENTRRDILGVQWCSSIFPDRAPPGMVLWRVLCGGVHRADVFDWDDETVLRACHKEMQQALGVRGDPVFTRIIRWPRAIPQYCLGHPQRVERIEAAAARHPGLYLTGNSYHGIAMNDVTEQAEQIAQRIRDYLQAKK